VEAGWDNDRLAEVREIALLTDDEAFVHLFGPEKIADNLGEFLDYFMVRKVTPSRSCYGPPAPSPRSSPRGSASVPISTHTASTSQSTGDQQRFGTFRGPRSCRACSTSKPAEHRPMCTS
jgi:hypothetical protein